MNEAIIYFVFLFISCKKGKYSYSLQKNDNELTSEHSVHLAKIPQ